MPQSESESQTRAERIAHDVERAFALAESGQAVHFGLEIAHVAVSFSTEMAQKRGNEAALIVLSAVKSPSCAGYR